MSYGQVFLLAKKTWILYKKSSSGQNTNPIKDPTSILNMALLSNRFGP